MPSRRGKVARAWPLSVNHELDRRETLAALGMSMISMLGMEAAMNVVDYFLVGGARLTLWVLPLMWLAGFLTPWPYNYWRLAKHGKSCCHAE